MSLFWYSFAANLYELEQSLLQFLGKTHSCTLPKFNSSPLKSYRNPGKDRLPFPPFFRCFHSLLNFGAGCIVKKATSTQRFFWGLPFLNIFPNMLGEVGGVRVSTNFRLGCFQAVRIEWWGRIKGVSYFTDPKINGGWIWGGNNKPTDPNFQRDIQATSESTTMLEATNWWVVENFPFPTGLFQVPAVSFLWREALPWKIIDSLTSGGPDLRVSGIFVQPKCSHRNYIYNIWVFPKIGGKPPTWMVYNGKPYEQMDDLGGVFPPLFLGWHPYTVDQ